MCTLVSFVLTKNDEYSLQYSNFTKEIIKHFGLVNNEEDIVKIDLFSPINREYFSNASFWEFKVNQKIYPDWTFEGDFSLEERARNALQNVINKKKTGYFVEKLRAQSVILGDKGIAIAGNHGISIAGSFGFAKSGDYGIATVGYLGQAVSGICGRSEAGILGIAIAGMHGTAISSAGGRSKTNDCGISIAGDRGIAISGKNGISRVGKYGAAIAKEYGYAESKEGGIAKTGNKGTICIEYYQANARKPLPSLPWWGMNCVN
jgi:hypothetical protein